VIRTFMEELARIMAKDRRVVLLCGDVMTGTDPVRVAVPDRLFNVGVIEQSMVGIGAGMASVGLRPVLWSMAPFVLERPFEAIKMDLDRPDSGVILAGFDHPDYSPSHCALDARKTVSLFHHIDGHFPKTAQDAADALHTALRYDGSSFIMLKR
jgi:transketolase